MRKKRSEKKESKNINRGKQAKRKLSKGERNQKEKKIE